MILAAEQAGDGELHPVAHQLHPEGGFAAGAGQFVGGRRQLEYAALHRHALAAGGTEIGQSTLASSTMICLHFNESGFCCLLYRKALF